MKRWITDGTILALLISAGIVGASLAAAFKLAFPDQGPGALARDLWIAFIGSAAGAWGGAFATQRIAERSALRKGLIDEVRSTNKAHAYAVRVFNTAVALHRQFSAPLFSLFKEQTKLFESGAPLEEGTKLPLLKFTVPVLGSDSVVNQVFSNVDASPRTQAITLALEEAVHSLSQCVADRNVWIEAFRAEYEQLSLDALYSYFGTRRPDGRHDERHANLVKNIYESAKRVIWFSNTLCSLLTAHGVKTRSRFAVEFGEEGAPRLNRSTILDNSDGVVPTDAEFPSWSPKNFPPES